MKTMWWWLFNHTISIVTNSHFLITISSLKVHNICNKWQWIISISAMFPVHNVWPLLPRNLGADGDLVMELIGGGAVDMQSVPDFVNVYNYIFDRISPEAQSTSAGAFLGMRFWIQAGHESRRPHLPRLLAFWFNLQSCPNVAFCVDLKLILWELGTPFGRPV